jgi:hypothetical protein
MKFCVEVEQSSSKGNVCLLNVTWSFVWYKVGESSSKGNVYLKMLHEVLCGSRIEFEQRKCLSKCYMKFCVEVE